MRIHYILNDEGLNDFEADYHWQLIMKKLKQPEFKEVHKFYSSKGGWAFLTTKKGLRYKFTKGISFKRFIELFIHLFKS